jgi:hypothetical protein
VIHVRANKGLVCKVSGHLLIGYSTHRLGHLEGDWLAKAEYSALFCLEDPGHTALAYEPEHIESAHVGGQLN